MEGHELIAEICGFINRWPVTKDTWKRVRIAVTAEELEQIKRWICQDDPEREVFFLALRGVPLVVEPNPTKTEYIMETM